MFEKFEEFEKRKDYINWFKEIDKILLENWSIPESYIRMIYFLHNYLLEEVNNELDVEFCKANLLKYFNEWLEKFWDDDIFLFFIWKILYISEWYFWLSDDDKVLEEKLAFKMQLKALSKKPDNILYNWAVTFSRWDLYNSNKLKEQILNDKTYLNWLIWYGFPWIYIISCLKFKY